LARVWAPKNSAWCRPEVTPTNSTTLSPGENAEGMIYVKSYKASSSTCEGIALNIAHHMARRKYGDSSQKCIAYTRHEFANKKRHARRAPDSSLLWSFVRHPQKRDMSHIFHFKIGRNQLFAQNDSQAIIDVMKTSLKGFQTRYLVPDRRNRDSVYKEKWPRRSLRKHPEKLMLYLKQSLMENYDFLGLTERMEESLAVMVLLWGLELSDVIVLSSKRSGGYDAGGRHKRCTKIPKAVTTPAIEEYLSTEHPIENVDYLLYHVANESLDLTIQSLGVEKVQKMVESIQELRKVVDENCQTDAMFPCSLEGVYQPDAAKSSCYVQDAGCGHKCVDHVLQNRTQK
jgi:hypothetical protein